nr:putative bromo adjacent homology (BAH) domain protein [Tanacetum cinerariifolium]
MANESTNRSEERFRSCGGKRPLTAISESESELSKKARGNGDSEVRLAANVKKVAKILLVLATMVEMRGGRKASSVEVEMMIEARRKLVEICEEFGPKDVFENDVFGIIVDDLGLGRMKETKLAACCPKMSIIDKLEATKKELSREQVYWLPAAEIASQSSTPAKPVAPFVHTRPIKSDVHKKVWKIKECITAFEKIIKERTAPPPIILSSHRLWHHTKECFDEQITPFFNNIKQLFQTLDTNIFQEVKEFEQIFDELDAGYERILLEKKNMQIKKKNLLITNECLIANSIANDICSIALAYDLVVPPSSDSSHCMLEELRTTCDKEHSKILELEAEILQKQQVINDAEK